jgi:hypothetical protein
MRCVSIRLLVLFCVIVILVVMFWRLSDGSQFQGLLSTGSMSLTCCSTCVVSACWSAGEVVKLYFHENCLVSSRSPAIPTYRVGIARSLVSRDVEYMMEHRQRLGHSRALNKSTQLTNPNYLPPFIHI